MHYIFNEDMFIAKLYVVHLKKVFATFFFLFFFCWWFVLTYFQYTTSGLIEIKHVNLQVTYLRVQVSKVFALTI